MTVYLLLCIAFLFGLNFSSVWVQLWTNSNAAHGTNNVGYWLGIYGTIAAIAIIGSVSSDLVFKLHVVPKTSAKFHELLLSTTVKAPLSFLTSTDSGTITNRFSQDLQLIDNDLPEAFDRTVFHILSAIASAVLVFIGSGYVAAAIPVCVLILYMIQAYYLRTSRQLRLLDIEAEAPLFSQFLETLDSVACIRAYGWTDAYLERSVEILNYSQKPYYLLWCIQRWLTLVLDLFVAGVAVLLVAFATNLRSGTSAFLGTALYNVVNFSMTLQLLVAEWTLLETAVGAVNRVRAYAACTACEHLPSEEGELPKDWPSEGGVNFTNVSAGYGAASEPVLRDINLKIRPGEKVAICGRTGFGKSSLVLTLTHMLEVLTGHITIDDVDVCNVPREELRMRLNAVPQEAFFLPGTVRDNVDPLQTADDQRIVSILNKLGLWDSLLVAGGLDADLDEDSLSHGQRQLFGLAKGLLRPGKLVLLDETTSSVDSATEQLMHSALDEELAGCTVVAIAHRLDAVLDYNKVVILDHGRICEVGNPRDLRDTAGTGFKAMYEAAASSTQKSL
ncbi:hypothetical protein DOTSEDRAFT_70457 [Dothistroma septosporum NZE10]|uniref:ABC transporter-like protein n=1 Tax=Dothistroma septosporum (strain NZE10 / CBS 128990) TaxID=675120 RepID=N1PVM3_DOTSN|nr:hypothetical protein DOTSEDRAFT_70457 [Dothistroma septosporum NZE10]